MGGTYSAEVIADLIGLGLLVGNDTYRRRDDGSLQYDGARPGPQWHAHGYMPRLLVARADGARVRLWKRRWLRLSEGEGPRTCHSRPPDDLASVWSSATVLVLKLWAYLDSDAGIVTHEESWAMARLGGSRRTVQRWLKRAQVSAVQTLQAIRRAVIERSEPRPAEQLFPGGLSPPKALVRRHRCAPASVSSLWQAFTFVVGGALALNVPAPVLLAEARRRRMDRSQFLI